MQSIDLGAGGSASFPFDTIGDTVTGRVTNLEEVQQTDLNTGQPAFWDNGQPKMMYRAELQTQLRDDDDDDGTRSIYLKGSKKPEAQSSLSAVLQAVRTATGKAALAVGGTLTLTYIGDGVAKQRGHNAPKLYAAQYVAPSVDLSGEQAPAAPAAQFQQPAQAAAAPVYQQPAPQAAAPVYTPPAAAPVPAVAPAAPVGPTPEQIAAIRAAGMDPAAVFPGWQG